MIVVGTRIGSKNIPEDFIEQVTFDLGREGWMGGQGGEEHREKREQHVKR